MGVSGEIRIHFTPLDLKKKTPQSQNSQINEGIEESVWLFIFLNFAHTEYQTDILTMYIHISIWSAPQ